MPPCRDAAARHAAAATPCAATLRRHYFIDYAITPPFFAIFGRHAATLRLLRRHYCHAACRHCCLLIFTFADFHSSRHFIDIFDYCRLRRH
jgi:hypothetical protein